MDARTRQTPALIATALLGVGLIAVLELHLFLALLTGLAAFALHHALLRWAYRRVAPRWQQAVAMVAFWVVLALVVGAGIIGFESLGLGTPGDALLRLTDLLADSLEKMRAALPTWLTEHLPESVDTIRIESVAWLKSHGAELRGWGMETLRAVAHLLIGLVIGLLASMHASHEAASAPAFRHAWRAGLARLVRAFTGVMGAQVRIAAVNTALTALYLLVVAPLVLGAIPLAKVLVVLTFVAGLIPVLGNLVSNSAIVLASLTVSPGLAGLSIAYLVAIHKLEYFLNARLVGGRIQARTYELLGAMLLFDALFGLKGLVAAPIYYAWLMGVLRDEGWV